MLTRDEIIFGKVDTHSALILMSEGNGGTLSVLTRISMDHPERINLLLHVMDDMNIRGEQILIAFYRYARSNIDDFTRHILGRSMDMVEFINAECKRTGNCIYKAVTKGAAGNRQKL